MKKMNNKIGWLFAIALGLASCKVTQPYQRPPAVANKLSYRDTVDKAAPNGNAAVIADTTSIATLSWKQMFSDTALQALIGEGINNNLDLKIAVARIKEAQANFRQSNAAFFPSLNANADATFQKAPSSSVGSNQSYEAYLGSSWEVDLWGKLKSANRAELALLMQSYAYKRAVQTQLIASIATDYYALLAYDEELKVTRATVENRKEDVTVTKALKEGDVLTGAAVMQSQANVFSAAVTIPDLKESIRETENAISILLARNPGAIKRDSLDKQTVATNLAAGVPLQLLSNRPDVQEAEYQLRSAAELTNVARTYFYPALTITAEGGTSTNRVAQLFNPSSIFGNIVGGLTQSIFNNGLNTQRLEVAKGQQEEYFYTFRETLLTATQEVSDALYRYQAASNKISIRTKEIFFLQKSVDYTKELMKYNSNTNYTDVLTSEQNLLAAELSGIADKLQQLQAVVTLYSSLGGGWK
jgi:multidrug efflux system outer membrane protein